MLVRWQIFLHLHGIRHRVHVVIFMTCTLVLKLWLTNIYNFIISQNHEQFSVCFCGFLNQISISFVSERIDSQRLRLSIIILPGADARHCQRQNIASTLCSGQLVRTTGGIIRRRWHARSPSRSSTASWRRHTTCRWNIRPSLHLTASSTMPSCADRTASESSLTQL